MYNAVVPSFPRKKQPPENSWGVTRWRQPKATCHWTVLVHEFQSTLCMSLQNFTGLLFHKLLYVPAVQSHCWLGDLVSAAVKLSQVSQFGHGGVCVSTGVWIKNKKKNNQPTCTKRAFTPLRRSFQKEMAGGGLLPQITSVWVWFQITSS